MGKYEYTPKCREISGFGGSYEAACRQMVIAGMEWFDKYPQASPKFHQYSNITGIVVADDPDAKSLETALMEAVGDCSGAMMQAAVNHCLFAAKNGWEVYIAKMEEEK